MSRNGQRSSAVPGTITDECPPIGSSPGPGTAEPFEALSPTVRRRPLVRPVVWPADRPLRPLDDPYIRRYWVPLLGPGAIADLLRLAAAAGRGRSLPRPRRLAELARADLVRFDGTVVMVRHGVPDVPTEWLRRLPPRLRRELTASAGAR